MVDCVSSLFFHWLPIICYALLATSHTYFMGAHKFNITNQCFLIEVMAMSVLKANLPSYLVLLILVVGALLKTFLFLLHRIKYCDAFSMIRTFLLLLNLATYII
jgi:hypothetical protein